MCSSMANFNLEAFVSNPSQEVSKEGSFNRNQWVDIATHYEIPITKKMSKRNIRMKVLDYLVEKELIDERHEPTYESSEWELRKFELEYQREERERDREEREREREERERERKHEREERERVRQHELEMARLGQPRGQSGDVTTDNFNRDWSRAKQLIPKFSEDDPDEFFTQFEETARTMEWPIDKWPFLVQTALTGKGLSVYLSLENDTKKEYQAVKREVLKAYEITGESYRRKFRNTRNGPDQHYLEYSRQLSKLMEKWWRFQDIKAIEDAKRVFLLEQFLEGVPTDVRIYLCQQSINNIQNAASLAEDYVLITGSKQKSSAWKNGASEGHNQGNVSVHATHNKCQKVGHYAKECRVERPQKTTGKEKSTVVCFRCQERGHYSAECPRRAAAQASASGKQRVTQVAMSYADGDMLGDREVREEEPTSNLDSYVTSGNVALSEVGEEVPVKVLRDTGATQSLLLKKALPQVEQGYTGDSILLRGLGGVVRVPLCRVFLKMKGQTRWVSVEIADELPISNVDLLMGNDIGGGVLLWPLMTDNPITEELGSQGTIREGDIDYYPACALNWQQKGESGSKPGLTCAFTRSQMAKIAESEDYAIQGVGDLFNQSLSREPQDRAKVPGRSAEADRQVTEEADSSVPARPITRQMLAE